MIKAVILDIDGVIVGSKKGINFPHPSKNVCKALRKVRDSGIPVVFLTAKTSFAASENIKYVGIDNPHISDAGSVLFNPIRQEIIKIKTLTPSNVRRILSLIPNNKFVHLFTTKDYFILRKVQEKFPDFVKKYGDFMMRLPISVESFDKVIEQEKIIRINISAFDNKEKNQITKMISKSAETFTYKWATNPYIYPVQIMIVTSRGISKASGVKALVKYLKVSLDDVLGIGDMLVDWDFLKLCGYKATLANGSEELKEKFDFSDKKQFIGKHVDEDGILDVLKYFKLL